MIRNWDFSQLKIDLQAEYYERIGSGSGRWVFDLKNGNVLKLAKNRKGVAQNITEKYIWTDSKSNLLANILNVSEDFELLIMIKAEKTENMRQIREFFHVNSNMELLQLQELNDIIKKYYLLSPDLLRSTNWGFVNNRPVIIDYGFTKEVKRKYYGIF